MPHVSTYPVFEPDQVLTDTHLNGLFAYLDQQERLTRNRLLGIGIVCGLNITVEENTIAVSKGVGITSLGYLLEFDGGSFTDFRPYTVPDFPDTIEPAVHAFYAGWNAQLLVPAEKKEAADKPIKENPDVLKRSAVVLFLEPQLSDLKNCTTEDCNDKGRRVDLTVRPLLVPKAVLGRYKYFNLQQKKFVFPQVYFKRWNVPVQNMQHPANVLQAFDNVLDAKLLNEVAAAYDFVFDVFEPVLASAGDNKPADVYGQLTKAVLNVRKAYPVFYQYLYDYVDDLIKAYLDFQEVVFDVLSECCPDESLFPLHLSLGEAGLSSATDFSAYRNEFIYSPLFSQQKEKLSQARLYYKRMLLLLKDFDLSLAAKLSTFTLANNRLAAGIRITPSCLGDYPLGKRCIPYYYNPKELFQVWDAEKTRRGKATTNYGYHADMYSNDAAALQPLLYDTERFNFYRIEGHAGVEVNMALQNIALQKQRFNLPFDVVALNMYPGQVLDEKDRLKCYFNDLESQYNVLISELLCKLHGLYCAAGKWPFNKKIFESVFRTAGVGTNAGAFREAGTFFSTTGTAAAGTGTAGTDTGVNLNEGNTGRTFVAKTYDETLQVIRAATISFVDAARRVNPYQKGAYMRHFCQPDPKAETVAAYYLKWLPANEGKRWPKPSGGTTGTNATQWVVIYYFHLFYLIDTVEELLRRILPFDLHEMTYAKFKTSYDEVMEEVEAFADYFDNVMHGMDILRDQTDINQQKPFNLIEEELEDWIIDKSVTKVVADSRALLMMCVDDRLQQLLYEHRKRVAYVLEQHVFSQYAKLKTGLEHKAGVPKGGTFVMLYFDKPDRRQVFADSLTANNLTLDVAENVTASENEKIVYRKTKPTDEVKLEQNVSGIAALLEKNKAEFSQEEFAQFSKLLLQVRKLPASAETLRIPEGVVFADLYIPFMCCSECAPTAFVFQDKVEETPQPDIAIGRTFFCNNEDVKEPITVRPEGGTVTGQGVIKEGDAYFFNPKGLAEDNYVLQYKAGEKTDTVNVTVKAVYDPAFTYQAKGTDPASGGVIVSFTATAQAGQHTWDFGDGSAASNDVAPQHTYNFSDREAQFEVAHTVTNGNCTLPPLKQTVRLVRETPISLSIDRNPLCSNDGPQAIVVSPIGGAVTCPENAQAVQQTPNGAVFLPQAAGQGTFTVRYEVNGQAKQIAATVLPAPTADFEARIVQATKETRVIQFQPASTPDTHTWDASDGQHTTEAAPKLEFRLADHPEGVVKVSHTLKNDVCGANVTKEISLQLPVKESEINLCYTKEKTPLEPNLPPEASAIILEEGGASLNEKVELLLSDNTPTGNSSFGVRYIVSEAGEAFEKRVKVNVSRPSDEVRLRVEHGVLFVQSPASEVSWTISINNGQPQVVKTGTENPLPLKIGSEVPRVVELGFIVAAEVKEGECKTAFVKMLPAAKYRELIATGGETTL